MEDPRYTFNNNHYAFILGFNVLQAGSYTIEGISSYLKVCRRLRLIMNVDQLYQLLGDPALDAFSLELYFLGLITRYSSSWKSRNTDCNTKRRLLQSHYWYRLIVSFAIQ